MVLKGVIPANLIAFDTNLQIDEKNYRRHIRYIVDTEGVSGITTNGHAAEISTLTVEEQQRSLSITVDEVDGKVPVICGMEKSGQYESFHSFLSLPFVLYDRFRIVL